MNFSRIAALVGVLLLVGTWGNVIARNQKLSQLRTQILQRANADQAPESIAPESRPAPDSGAPSAEKLELLRLRGELARLRQEELAPRSSLPSAPRADGSVIVPLPEGFHPAGQMRFAGFSTPENALESVLWAARTGDTNVLLQALPSQIAEQVVKSDFSTGLSTVLGFQVTSTEWKSDSYVILNVQIDPRGGMESLKMPFELVNNVWKLALPHF